MKHRPLQRPLAGHRFDGYVAKPRRRGASFRGAGLLALLALVLGWSANALAQGELTVDVATASSPDSAEQLAQWCGALHETPQAEVSALEAEADNEPVAPELPSIIRPVFGGTARITTTGQVLHVATETYSPRFAASPVLARAPPRGARC